MTISRREFLGSTTAAVMAASVVTGGKVFGANENIGVCVMGCNTTGRGASHIEGFSSAEGSEVVAICDADERILERTRKLMEKKTGKSPKTYVDIRDALQDPAIDAVSIATPNHWHTLATIWACEAGKDVYVEKPATHNIYEGQQIQAAAEKYDRIVQHGTQSRSSKRWIRDIKLLQSGEIIGPLYMARGLGYKNGSRGSLKHPENGEPPRGLNWRQWQGPASEQAYNPAYHPYSWHWFWHYGNGEIGNQGIHQLDVAVWGMNRGMPVSVTSTGGRYTYDDIGETPNTNVATFTYEDGTMLVFEVRNRFTNDEAGVKVGNLFYGNEGYYVQDRGFFDTKDQKIELSEDKYPFEKEHSCWQNFVNSVKDRNKDGIHGNMLAAHESSGHAHLANTAYRLARTLKFDPNTEKYIGDDEANTHISREYAEGYEVPKLA